MRWFRCPGGRRFHCYRDRHGSVRSRGDRDGDERLSFEEFRRTAPAEAKLSDGDLKEVFAHYDVDKDSFISVSDMQVVLRRAKERVKKLVKQKHQPVKNPDAA